MYRTFLLSQNVFLQKSTAGSISLWTKWNSATTANSLHQTNIIGWFVDKLDNVTISYLTGKPRKQTEQSRQSRQNRHTFQVRQIHTIITDASQKTFQPIWYSNSTIKKPSSRRSSFDSIKKCRIPIHPEHQRKWIPNRI